MLLSSCEEGDSVEEWNQEEEEGGVFCQLKKNADKIKELS
jgi:hypothetical protein